LLPKQYLEDYFSSLILATRMDFKLHMAPSEVY